MLWAVYQALIEDRQVEGYQLVAPIKWSLPENGEPPLYYALLETIWEGGPPAVTLLGGSRLDGFPENFSYTKN
jgi:hypothetical protein